MEVDVNKIEKFLNKYTYLKLYLDETHEEMEKLMEDLKQLEYREFQKRNNELCMIASENYPSEDVLDANGSIFICKYSEGFPGKRYYQGCEVVDEMEQKCIDECLKLFNATGDYLANVQPNSGASANMIVYNAVLQPNDTVLAMDVKSGSHISHSHPKSFIAKYHNVITYGVDDDGFLDYDEIEKLAMECKPKLIICGASNYPRIIDFKRFKEIADKCGALLMADIAHISMLVAHKQHPTPVNYADFITFTTHKTMRSTRGGCIIYKKEFDKQIKLSTIPSLFGGALQNHIYAKLVGFVEAQKPEAKLYAQQIIDNAHALAGAFLDNNIPLVTGGTDNHLMTVDLTDFNISGKQLAVLLEQCGIIVNCNTVPNDKRSFLETSGIRIGVPAITTRGLDMIEVYKIGSMISDIINCFRDKEDPNMVLNFNKALRDYVDELVEKYPLSNIYPKRAKEAEENLEEEYLIAR